MRTANIVKEAGTYTLMTGSAITLGFLSFAGLMSYGLWVGFAGFALTFIWEGEIYRRNISNALTLLFTPDSVKQEIANEWLEQHLQAYTEVEINLQQLQCELLALAHYHDLISMRRKQHIETLFEYHRRVKKSPFLQEYQSLAKQSEQCEHENEHTNELAARREYLKRYLFGQLAAHATSPTRSDLDAALPKNALSELPQQAASRRWNYRAKLLFSLAAGICSSVGTIFGISTALAEPGVQLALQTFFGMFATTASSTVFATSAIAFMSSMPFLIPITVISALAFSCYIYDAMTGLTRNNTLQNIRDELTQQLSQGSISKRVGYLLLTTFSISLGIALFYLTGSTWYVAAQQALPALGITNPAWVSGLTYATTAIFTSATLSWTFENTASFIRSISGINPVEKFRAVRKQFYHATRNETEWQRWNPFRLVESTLSNTVSMGGFLAHSFAVAATTDHGPGIPRAAAILIGATSDGIGDAGALLNTKGHDGHDHGSMPDFLAQGLVAILMTFSGIKFFGAIWDYGFSQKNTDPENRLTVGKALQRAFPLFAHKHDHHHHHHNDASAAMQPLTKFTPWQKTVLLDRVDTATTHYQTSQMWLSDKHSASKATFFLKVREQLATDESSLNDVLNRQMTDNAKQQLAYHRNRLFSESRAKTMTYAHHTINDLKQIATACAA